MRTKSLVEPMGVAEGHEWLSPDGHSPSWHRIFQDGKWEATVYEEMEDEEIDPDSLEEIEVTIDDTPKGSILPTDDDGSEDDGGEESESTEGNDDEQGMSTEVSNSDGGEQGSGGKSSAKPQQRGKRGKVRKGGKGK